jgi:hypothetical protein
MQGVDAEIRNMFSRSSLNYIITSRILQGQEDLTSATAEEQNDILLRWTAKGSELAAFYKSKGKDKESQDSPSSESSAAIPRDGEPDPEPKTGWKYTKNLSLDERKKLHAQKEAWQKRQAARQAAASSGSNQDASAAAEMEDEDFEQAIQDSVRQTSRGNKAEDEQIERQIRASVLEMRKIAQQNRDFGQPVSDSAGPGSRTTQSQAAAAGVADEEFTNVTDEEYAELIQRAVQESLRHGTSGPRRHNQNDEDNDDEELRRAIAASRSPEDYQADSQHHGEDADMKRAMQESEKAHQEHQNRAKTEEETVMEYVKRQSLAEEEFRRQRAKAKAPSADEDDHDDEDEDLKRALEESLKSSGGAGPSHA